MTSSSPAIRLLSLFQAGAVGHVLRRASTYWTLIVFHESLSQAGVLIRLNFGGRAEARFSKETFSALAFPSTHPFLLDYLHPWYQLVLASPSANPGGTLSLLASRLSDTSGGWRQLGPYLTLLGAERVLASGTGPLLVAPEPFSLALAELLRSSGVQLSVKPCEERRRPAQLAILGDNFIVAKRFRVAWAPPNPAFQRTRCARR